MTAGSDSLDKVQRAVFRVRTRGSKDCLSRLWLFLRERFPELPQAPPDGVAAYDLVSASLWCSISLKQQFIAVHCQPADGGFWQVFLVPHLDGHLRGGWRRRSPERGEPPPAWCHLLEEADLLEEVTTAGEPDFLLLAVAHAAGDTPRIAYDDAAKRAALTLERDHWRDLASARLQEIGRLNELLARRPSRDASHAAGETQRERTLADLGAWAEENADRIVVMPRAVAEAKRSVFADPQAVFDALELLADTYRAVKLSLVPRERLKEKADALGLLIGGSVDPSRAGSYGDDYFVNFAGRRRFLDQHLGRGSSRDPRFTMRVYYFWDPASQRAVVGSLPGHLSNSMT